MGDNESGDGEGDGSLEQLVKDLAGSREMMSSLTQALIPRLMEQLKSGEVLNDLLQDASEKGDLARKFGGF